MTIWSKSKESKGPQTDVFDPYATADPDYMDKRPIQTTTDPEEVIGTRRWVVKNGLVLAGSLLGGVGVGIGEVVPQVWRWWLDSRQKAEDLAAKQAQKEREYIANEQNVANNQLTEASPLSASHYRVAPVSPQSGLRLILGRTVADVYQLSSRRPLLFNQNDPRTDTGITLDVYHYPDLKKPTPGLRLWTEINVALITPKGALATKFLGEQPYPGIGLPVIEVIRVSEDLGGEDIFKLFAVNRIIDLNPSFELTQVFTVK